MKGVIAGQRMPQRARAASPGSDGDFSAAVASSTPQVSHAAATRFSSTSECATTPASSKDYPPGSGAKMKDEVDMAKTVEATYEDGVVKPKTPVDIEDQ